MKKSRICKLFLLIILTTFSINCFAEVNCSRDFQDAGNLTFKGDNDYNKSYQHDLEHEKLIYDAKLSEAKLELQMATTLATEALSAYSDAKVLYEGIIDYGCRYKIKKSRSKVYYIDYRLDHLEYKINIMNLMQNFL